MTQRVSLSTDDAEVLQALQNVVLLQNDISLLHSIQFSCEELSPQLKYDSTQPLST